MPGPLAIRSFSGGPSAPPQWMFPRHGEKGRKRLTEEEEKLTITHPVLGKSLKAVVGKREANVGMAIHDI